MAQIRPKVLLTEGFVQQPVRIQLGDVLVDPITTFLTSDSASDSSTLTVKNISGFAVDQILMLGNPANQGTEIVTVDASTAPTGSTITLAANTVLPHSASTFVYVIPFDQVEFSIASTISGSKTVLGTVDLLADQFYTEYNDTTSTAGFYFTRFKNSVSDTFSSYSDPAPYEGYGLLSARSVIDAALGAINKQTSEVLSDTFAFTELDNFQTEVLREMKRWSFMQKFDSIIGQATTGSWKVAIPDDLDDQNTNKSIYTIRIGGEFELTWVDKEKFDEFFIGVSYTTLSSALNASDTTMTLANSNDFSSEGTVTIGANSYSYTANDTATGVLTLSTTIDSSNTASVGDDVFQGATQGLPQYWTTYGGYIYYLPNTGSTYDGRNIYMDYYIKQTRITSNYSNLIVPDQTAAVYYLAWKFLRKLNNGEDTQASLQYKQDYLLRREKMKQKESMNRTFKLKPLYQDFRIQSAISSETPRFIRDGNFNNTGF